MRNLLKMDLRQLFHRKILYVMIVALSAINSSMLYLSSPTDVSIEFALGIMKGVNIDNFMMAANGLGLVYTLACIMLSFFVCDNFSSGFAKNIFTVHAKKTEYIGSKILSAMIGSAILMLFSLAESLGFCIINHIMTGNIGGLLIFWIEKWIMAVPFAAAILFISLWLRNKGLGFLFSCLLGTGGLVMGVSWAFEVLHVPYADQILSMTMYGASTIPTLQFQTGDVLHIMLAAVCWSIFYSVLGAAVLKRKEI